MLTEVILWNYCNVWKFPSASREADFEAAYVDSEWDAFGRVMDKVRTSRHFTDWAKTRGNVVH